MIGEQSSAFQGVVSATMDRGSKSAMLHFADGSSVTMPLDSPPFAESSRLSRATYSPATNEASATTISGDEVSFELPTIADMAPTAGRVVVYLDQKDWSTLANSVAAPARVSKAEQEAAARIVSLVHDGKLLLPMSSSHLAETCKWKRDDRRYALALTMLRLSRGWQLRDPLAVRRDEIRASFRRLLLGGDFKPRAVVTLEPDAIHEARTSAVGRHLFPRAWSEVDLTLAALRCTLGTADALLDNERVPLGSSFGWVQAQQQFTDVVANHTGDSRQKRKLIMAYLLRDLRLEVADSASLANLSTPQFETWLSGPWDAEFSAMPSLGVFREVMCEKFLNPGTKWQENDLSDIVYLACGAAYADFVVCERVHGSAIKQGLRRLGRKDNVALNLVELVQLLEHAGL